MTQRRELPVLGTIILALIWPYPAAGALKSYQSVHKEENLEIPRPGDPFWWAQIDFTKPHGIAWSVSDFATLAQSGMNGVEINLDWADIEPQKDRYDFQLLDRYMEEAAKVHLKIYLLFWESLWGEKQGKNPPPWISARDISSDGFAAEEPPWWDENSRKAYFNYVAHTIDHVKASPGFGGVYASYGWLDSEWGAAPQGSHGVTGYAPADIQAFYRWLPQTYKTIANFNQRWQSSYHSWNSIPVPRPGDRLFPLYQRFRQYSVLEAFNAISQLVRAHTNATLLYSWGGQICGLIGPTVQGNDPDAFFEVAKKYHAIINLDDANAPGLALLFGSLARSYGVPLLQEWTPHRGDLRPEVPQWLGHIGLAAPREVGEDFFIYPPASQRLGFVEAWSAYREWHATMAKVIQGKTPEQPVAVIVPMHQISLSANLNTFPNLTQELGDFWQHYYVLPHFITDQQVAERDVSLQQFRAVVDLGNEVAALSPLKEYAAKHPVLKTLDQAIPYLRPYVAVDPPTDSLEVTPTVKGSIVWLTFANCNDQHAYSGTIRFNPAAVGLRPASPFRVKDAKTGQPVPATRGTGGTIQWQIDLPRAGFQILQLSFSN
ncbi:MAG TPA: beta-galactosidase [Terriglobia bacterium]|nr:beta-galactosidase [Terriglobia bacterium]